MSAIRDAWLARAVTLHPAGFGAVDADLLRAAPSDIAERLLAAVAAAIGGSAYPARRERVARLYEMLTAGASGGHTLGGLPLRPLARAYPGHARARRRRGPGQAVPGAGLWWDRRFRGEAAGCGFRPGNHRLSRAGAGCRGGSVGSAAPRREPAAARSSSPAGGLGRSRHRRGARISGIVATGMRRCRRSFSVPSIPRQAPASRWHRRLSEPARILCLER